MFDRATLPMRPLLLIIAFILSISPEQHPPIAFTMVQDGEQGLYLIEPTGDNLQKLTDCPTGCYNPMWSNDGTHIGVATDAGFSIIDINNGEITNIVSNFGIYAYQVPQIASWKDDLSKVVYSARFDMEYSLVIVDFDDMEISRYDDVPVGVFRPIWENGRIIFESLGDVYMFENGETSLMNVSSADYEDSVAIYNDRLIMRVQTDDGYAAVLFEDDESQMMLEGIMDTFVWSPDGTKISANLWRDNTGTAVDIVVINVEHEDITTVADNGISLYTPTWSPDSTQLVYIGTDDNDLYGLFVVESSGENEPVALVTPLSKGNHSVSSPAWNKEGFKE